ncbi:uncharacterized protein LOC123555593 [Mercenaria mercenaria]|uniref:uncharacterized protein LOC123555593 n=1 Tax=Mercenaria mercenaria TaxID=6596 RepID=UPI00234FAC21|nr:uncharacterized protein LOC123555593 [Mercenaria mercenaria]
MSTSNDTQTTEECPKPFTEGGKCLDEVRLVFDDQQELFVSQNFLILSSPVFEAMFKNEFKEKQSKTVNLTGKNYADFLEFLMCIHPGFLNPITESNVLRIAPIAEEYQVASIVTSCKSLMKNWLDKELQVAKRSSTSTLEHVVPARQCLTILTTALSLNYETETAYAVDTIAKLPHRIYYGSYRPDTINSNYLDYTRKVNGVDVKVREIIAECRQLFLKLHAQLRCEILSKRLALYPGNEVM